MASYLRRLEFSDILSYDDRYAKLISSQHEHLRFTSTRSWAGDCSGLGGRLCSIQRRRLGVAGGATAPGPALEAYEFVKLYSPVNWKCWYMLRLKPFFKVRFRSVVLRCLLYRNRLWNLKLEAVKAAILKIFLQRIIYARCPQTGKNFMNNEKTKFVHQVAKVDLV